MSGSVQKVFHLAAFSWYAFVIKSLYAKGDEEPPPGIFPYGGPWKYLTFLNLILQMVYFGLASVQDQKSSGKLLRVARDLLFSVYVFPVGMFVVVMFWSIFAYDRQLVYPASLDAFFPPWMNHAMHTIVFPILLGEMLLQPHSYPKIKTGMTALGVVGLAYLSWVIWVYLSVGIWVYPLLNYFSQAGLIAFFFVNMTVVTLLYLMGQTMNNRLWGKKQKAKRKA
ncbi:androgen-dependent TFPI-regulating protein isoform X2 [Engraulis encrasicolus]|uniref:androgen-dependent TFPI-regulating protein isoform X2 n=1 Tax=Engraulis encrasicolus TaxID=184585 RepID=UPI002FD3E30E